MALTPITSEAQKLRILTLLTSTSQDAAGQPVVSALRRDFDTAVASGQNSKDALRSVLAAYNYDFSPHDNFRVDVNSELSWALLGRNYTPGDCPNSHVIANVIG